MGVGLAYTCLNHYQHKIK